IALAVTQTQGAVLKLSHCPLGTAVLCWGLSFFCGARHWAYVNSTLYANLALVRVQAGLDPRSGQHPEKIQAASEGIRAPSKEILKGPANMAWHSFGSWLPGPCCTLCGTS
ncbi:MAG TPA: hypothetical protein VEX68_14680, partial [Bryobacteraceae bacterium]|nr:hypothetical protein [Bryobacteraceae bacterium]